VESSGGGHRPDLLARFRERLNEVGFPLVGGTDYLPALPLYREHAEKYRQWVERGSHGAMGYLQRGLDRRMDPTIVFPPLRSVITIARPYSPHPVGDSKVRYARYLNGEDYHDSMKDDLERTFSGFKAEIPELEYKVCVDTSAVLERSWAALTGLGWIGKNTLLIHPQYGSFLFLGVVFTNLTLEQGPTPLKDYCGNCTRCLSACPTQALKPHDLEARRCISYLTLEKRGEWEEGLAEKIDTRGFIAGCDLCQEVCPYNTKAARYTPPKEQAPYLKTDLEALLNETEEEYRNRVRGTALSRVKYADFRRNLKAIL